MIGRKIFNEQGREMVYMDDRLFRTAMGRFATGVTVVTTEIDEEIYGMTANAFVSVSLNPKLVLVSIDEKATINPKIKAAGRFAVSILNENQEDLSNHFAGRNKDNSTIEFEQYGDFPVISGTIATIVCDVHKEVIAGDHTLYIGEVTDLRVEDGQPLTFFNGQYGRLQE